MNNMKGFVLAIPVGILLWLIIICGIYLILH